MTGSGEVGRGVTGCGNPAAVATGPTGAAVATDTGATTEREVAPAAATADTAVAARSGPVTAVTTGATDATGEAAG